MALIWGRMGCGRMGGMRPDGYAPDGYAAGWVCGRMGTRPGRDAAGYAAGCGMRPDKYAASGVGAPRVGGFAPK